MQDVQRILFQLDSDAKRYIADLDQIKQKYTTLIAAEEKEKQTTDQLRSKWEQLNNSRSKANNPEDVTRYNEELRKTSTQLDNAANRQQNLNGLMSSFAATLGIMSGGALLVGIGKDAIQMSMDFEQVSISFETMLGSADKAKKLLSDLVEFAKKTPFEFPELKDSAKQLLSFGIPLNNIMGDLKMLSTISAGNGKNLGELSYIYGTLATQQRAYTIDIRQFATAGIPIYDLLSKRLGVAKSELDKIIESGKISFDLVREVLTGLTESGGLYYGLLEKQSESAAGKLSTLKDSFRLMMKEVADTWMPAITGLFDVLIKKMDYVGVILKSMGTNTGNVFKGLVGIGLNQAKAIEENLDKFIDARVKIASQNEKLGKTEKERVTAYRDTLLFQLESEKDMSRNRHDDIMQIIAGANRFLEVLEKQDKTATKLVANIKPVKDYIEALRRKYEDLNIEIEKLQNKPGQESEASITLDVNIDKKKAIQEMQNTMDDIRKEINAKLAEATTGADEKVKLNRQLEELKTFEGEKGKIRVAIDKKYQLILEQQLKEFNRKKRLQEINDAKDLADMQIEVHELEYENEQKMYQIRLETTEKYYDRLIKLAEDNGASEIDIEKLKSQKMIALLRLQNEAKADTLNRQLAEINGTENHNQKMMSIARKSQLAMLNSQKESEQKKLDAMKAAGKEGTQEYQNQFNKVQELDAEIQDEKIKMAINIAEQSMNVIRSVFDLINTIYQGNIDKLDRLISLQEQRVESAKRLAEKGNAEILKEERKRLEETLKEREKFVRKQQALAQIELISYSTVAIAKAAAEGGIAAPFTIAATLIALSAGLIKAKLAAESAAYYEGGYTGDGNPREESLAVGKRPYRYHKGEFVFDHETTGENRDIFEAIHKGKLNLRSELAKASMFDRLEMGRTNLIDPNVIAYQLLGGQTQLMEAKLDNIEKAIKSIPASHLSIDERGIHAISSRVQFKQDRIRREAR